MSASVAIASSGISSASLAISAAAQSEAREASCNVLMRGYTDAAAATIETKQAYADCVYIIAPNPMSEGEVLLALLGAIIGAVAWRNNRRSNR